MKVATQTKQVYAWVERPGPDAKIELREAEIPYPGLDQVLVKLEVSGVCHSDAHSIYGNTPMTTHIAGHEGVGVVVSAGSNIDPKAYMGQRVGISWLHKSCGECDICSIDPCHCPYQLNSGRNVPGTFQRYCLADANHITFIPQALESAEAAPLLCGGVTMYGALRRAELCKGDFVVITGAGGGLGNLGVQLAVYRGLRVLAIDGGDAKAGLCRSLGAEHFIDFRMTTNVIAEVQRLTGGLGAHGVICAAGSPKVYDDAIAMLRPCGKLICIGIPPLSYRMMVSPFEMLVKGLRIIGSSVGTAQDMKELLDLAAEGKVKSTVEGQYRLSEIEAVMERLKSGEITGRALIDLVE